MSWLVAFPIVVPLIGAALCVLFGRSRATQRLISVSILAMIVVVSVVLLVKVDHDGPIFSWSGVITWWLQMVVFALYTGVFITLLRRMIVREDFGTGPLPELESERAAGPSGSLTMAR